LVIEDRPVTPITEMAKSSRQSLRDTPTVAGPVKDVNVLTTLNHVNLGNLTNLRSIDASLLTARAWGTLRAVVAGVTPTKTLAPVAAVAPARVDAQALVAPEFPRMLRGAERC
jgi:hypothetical protein